jgi:hypothetical protein
MATMDFQRCLIRNPINRWHHQRRERLGVSRIYTKAPIVLSSHFFKSLGAGIRLLTNLSRPQHDDTWRRWKKLGWWRGRFGYIAYTPAYGFIEMRFWWTFNFWLRRFGHRACAYLWWRRRLCISSIRNGYYW